MDAQLTTALVLAGTLILFIWGYWRYDLVALLTLLVLCLIGIVPAAEAFYGFGHPAVITVAAVLILSRGLLNAGIVQFIAKRLSAFSNSESAQIALLTALVTILSGFINNIGALALLMPVAIRLARNAGRSPASMLMPMAFGSLLGGMLTLIGTPSNLIIAGYRGRALDDPFGMFDFMPVGAVTALAGVVFIALFGWRLIPKRPKQTSQAELFEIEDYIAELHVGEKSEAIGKPLNELEQQAEGNVIIIGLVREGRRLSVPSAYESLRQDDTLIVEADAENLKDFTDKFGLSLSVPDEDESRSSLLKSDDLSVLEAIVLPESKLAGGTVERAGMRWRYGVNLLGVARQGTRIKQRLRDIRLRAGDVLLLQGPADNIYEALRNLGCLPLAERDLALGQPRYIALTLGIFVAAIGINSFGLLPVHIAMTTAAVTMVLLRLVSLREAYEAIDWPILILLGAMLPVGAALEDTGAAATAAGWLIDLSGDLPVAAIVAILLIGTMFLSDVINNAAAAVLMAPVAIQTARTLEASPDPFLMAIAVGAAAAFLTPIGHQSNTLVMGPGGYRFGDYWRMGLPLELIVTVAAMPMILWIWPP